MSRFFRYRHGHLTLALNKCGNGTTGICTTGEEESPDRFFLTLRKKGKLFTGTMTMCAFVHQSVSITVKSCHYRWPLQKWFMTARRLQQSRALYYRATTEQAGRLTGAKIIFTLRRKGGKECTMG